MKMSNTKEIDISQIKSNPNNPRVIKDEKFKKLVQSIKDFPEMLKARPIVVNPDMVVLGGNMRLKALKELGINKTWVYVADWEEAKNKEFVIKDNIGVGDHDWDALAEWDQEELIEWGLDVELTPSGKTKPKSNLIELKPFNQVHVLLSFHPDLFDKVRETLSALMIMEGIEYEQTSN
jgi:ParB-like chromosome segregation protein Spo0J